MAETRLNPRNMICCACVAGTDDAGSKWLLIAAGEDAKGFKRLLRWRATNEERRLAESPPPEESDVVSSFAGRPKECRLLATDKETLPLRGGFTWRGLEGAMVDFVLCLSWVNDVNEWESRSDPCWMTMVFTSLDSDNERCVDDIDDKLIWGNPRKISSAEGHRGCDDNGLALEPRDAWSIVFI